MLASKLVEVTREDGIAVLTLRRPEKRNALSLDVMRALLEAIRGVAGDRTVRALVLRGEGAAFSAGHDLRELLAAGETECRCIFDACVDLMTALHAISQPVVAEVATIASAAGCQLVAACDLAVASTQATFATPGVRIGLFCTTPMVALTRAVGRKRAMEMLLTGEAIDAQTALAWGLVNRVVVPERLHAETLDLARKATLGSRAVVAIGKAAFYRQIEAPEGEAYAYAKDVMERNTRLPDALEGMAAFLEKRAPHWPA